MLWALDGRDERIKPTHGAVAKCEGCQGEVVAHCGQIKRWHWHHSTTADCDPSRETETPWHIDWKSRFHEDLQEHWEKPHRADVLTWQGLVIEFQHSAIGPEDIAAREQHWNDLFWVFDASEWIANFEFRLHRDKVSFQWKHPRQSLWEVKKPLFLDTGTELFEIKLMGKVAPCAGVGRFIPYEFFVEQALLWPKNW